MNKWMISGFFPIFLETPMCLSMVKGVNINLTKEHPKFDSIYTAVLKYVQIVFFAYALPTWSSRLMSKHQNRIIISGHVLEPASHGHFS